MRLVHRPVLSSAVAAAILAALAGCGGGSSSSSSTSGTTSPPTAAPTLSGSVAVGAPITQGQLNIVDVDGNAVASNVQVKADGSYPPVPLTGTGPWRVEACGYSGSDWKCMYAVAQAAGTANVTPLTSAQVALALGQAPETLMQSAGAGVSAQALAAAQSRLQSGLAGTLTDAGLGASFDFTTGTLSAGTRTGYDRVLDAVAVTTGSDNGTFVQVTPRLGDGNLYITPSATQGTITTPTAASGLPLGGLTTLFNAMSGAMASASACTDATVGIAASLASDARVAMGGQQMNGRAAVAAGLCQMFAQGQSGSGAMWGSTIISPSLGRCDFSGTDPICAVSFDVQQPDGTVQGVSDDMAVVYRGGSWQFYGSIYPMEVHANAAVQRDHRVDDPTAADTYARALQFDIAATTGVQCVQVSQVAASGSPTTVAYYKVHEASAQRMSLWTTGTTSDTPSLDPSTGATRSNDDSWVNLPDGTAGDDVIRNFYQGGRTVTLSLFADAACATPATVGGKTQLQVDLQGVPPVWSAMPSLPWGALTDASTAGLESLTLSAGQTGTFQAAWDFASGDMGYQEATFCDGFNCGMGSISRIGYTTMKPSARSVSVSLSGPAQAVGAGNFKMFMLGGRDGSGMNIESGYFSCSSQAAGQPCSNP